MKKYTVVIIGAGPAGHTAAVRLAQSGAKVAIVERDFVGGICTNWGCTPSKSMIEAAKVARTVKESNKHGVFTGEVTVDFKQVAARRDEVIREAREHVNHLLNAYKIDVYQGEGEIIKPGLVRVKRGKLDLDGYEMHYAGEEEVIEASHIVLATGSQPIIPGFIGNDNPFVVSSNRLISIGELPKRLIVIGGGVIGLEFTTIFSNLGSQVTVIEFLDRVLATLDPQVSAAITHQLEQNGVSILTGHQVTEVEQGKITAKNRNTGDVIELESDAILISVGRKAVIDKDMFNRLGILYDEKGICVDDTLQTNVPGIWAIGDATGKSILAHVGIQQGIVAAENIMKSGQGKLRKMEYDVIPAVVYSIPEVASVGRVPENITGVETYTVPFNANLRARIEGFEEGFIKIWVKDDRVLAAQAIGHNVSEMIQELANMIALKTPIQDVAQIIHAHPTYSEITRSILEYALDKPVDFLPERVSENT